MNFIVKGISFTISLIPHTVLHTVVGDKQRGDKVNIECDMLAKYMHQMMANKSTPGASNRSGNMKDLLQQHGFTN